MKQKAFILDINKCTGCQACKLACSNEYNRINEISFRDVVSFNKIRQPEIPVFYLSIACNHCMVPSCLYSCPARAITKDLETGSVLINHEKCIACKYCVWACPYNAPHYNYSLNQMEKCDFCLSRINDGNEPACVNSCPVNALQFDDFKDEQNIEIPGFPNPGTKPAISFVSLRKREFPINKKTGNTSVKLINECMPESSSEVKLRSEWPLLVFTLLSSFLIGITASASFNYINFNPFLILLSGSFSLLLSSVHLGNKLKFYRSVFNIKKSWLSREIFFFILFLFFCAMTGIFKQLSTVFTACAAISGFISLFSMDKIYQTAQHTWKSGIHSAQVFYTATLFAAVFSGIPVLFSIIISLKFILYAQRKLLIRKNLNKMEILILSFRIIAGFIIPVSLSLINMDFWFIVIFIFTLVGEITDRLEFYNEFDIINPVKRARIDFLSIMNKYI